jgi:hypothetical protein
MHRDDPPLLNVSVLSPSNSSSSLNMVEHLSVGESPSFHSMETRSVNNEKDKKKTRKNDDSLQKLLDLPDCLNEGALTLNFLLRRLLCDIFHQPFFKDLLKEKIELKLKEMAVRDQSIDSIKCIDVF